MSRVSESLNVLGVLFRKYGVLGFARVIWDDVLFDYRKRVDTYAPVAKEELFGDDEERMRLQNRYIPSTFNIVNTAIEEARAVLGDELTGAGFIDYGSGKGKVLIAASRNGFERIRGIEFDQDLHQIATANMKKLGIDDRVELIHGDATAFSPEPQDRVLYFFNPFEGEILDKVLQNVKAVEPDGKRVLVLFNPLGDEIFRRYFEKVTEKVAQPGNARYAVYTG